MRILCIDDDKLILAHYKKTLSQLSPQTLHLAASGEEGLEIIAREKAVGVDTAVREASAQERLQAEQERLAPLEERWNAEKTLTLGFTARPQ